MNKSMLLQVPSWLKHGTVSSAETLLSF